MKPIAILALPALVVAMPATAQVRAPYKAVGTEPFWSLTIDRGTITYRPMEGRALTVRKPRPLTRPGGGQRYVARGLIVDILPRRCSDGMSDRSYADTVRVTVGRRMVPGCGGAVIDGDDRSERIASTRWTIAAIDGRAVRLSRPATMNFTAERLEGRICNSYGAAYRMSRDALTPEPVIATQMACPGEPMRVETRVFALLDGTVRVRWDNRETLTLEGAGGTITLRRTP